MKPLARIEKARKKIQRMQKVEEKDGFTSPEDLDPFQLLITVEAALKAGIATNNWDTVCEAYVMLETAVKKSKNQGGYK